MHLFWEKFFYFFGQKIYGYAPGNRVRYSMPKVKTIASPCSCANTSHIQLGSLPNLTYYTNATKIVTANVKNFTTQREKNAVRDI